jgi:hypothetical protein
MSPTIFWPGACAVKSRFTRSGTGPGSPGTVVVGRYGLGWAGDQVEFAHQLPHELGADLLALTNELGVHATIPVGLIGMFENRLTSFLRYSRRIAVAEAGRSRHS